MKATLIGPIECECGWQLAREEAEPRHLFCANKSCEHYRKQWLLPQVALKPVEGNA